MRRNIVDSPIDWSKFYTIDLDIGSHRTREDGLCVMEAVAWLAGEEHSDHPRCVPCSLAAVLRYGNDFLASQDARNALGRAWAPLIVGLPQDEASEARRAYAAADWAVRTCVADALEVAGLTEASAALRELPPINDSRTARRASAALSSAFNGANVFRAGHSSISKTAYAASQSVRLAIDAVHSAIAEDDDWEDDWEEDDEDGRGCGHPASEYAAAAAFAASYSSEFRADRLLVLLGDLLNTMIATT
jgi:hypothetical protein